MITVDQKTEALFRAMLGECLGSFSVKTFIKRVRKESNEIREVRDIKSVASADREIFFSIGTKTILLRYEPYDNEQGYCTHEFSFSEQLSFPASGETLIINSPPIERIRVYGNKFDPSEYLVPAAFHEKYKDETVQDNIFIFYFNQREPIAIVLEDFMGTVSIRTGSRINDYIERRTTEYTLHHGFVNNKRYFFHKLISRLISKFRK